MAVYKRPESQFWQIECTVTFGAKKETIRLSSRTTIKAEAEALEAKLRTEAYNRLALGVNPQAHEISVSQACHDYYHVVLATPNAKPKKLSRDRYYIDVIADKFGDNGKALLSDIEVATVATWHIEMVTKKKLSPAAANRQYGVLRAIVGWARNKCFAAPELKIKQHKVGKGRLRFLNAAEESALLLACDRAILPVVTVALDTGMRKGELLAMTWEWIDWSDNAIMIPPGITKSGEARRLGIPKRSRTYLLPEEHVEASLRGEPPTGSVFNLTEAQLRNRFDDAVAETGLKDLVFHVLRHTFASKACQRGAQLQDLKELLGHKEIKTTMIYAHMCQRTTGRRIAALLDS